MLSVKVFLNYKLIVISRILRHPIHLSLSLFSRSVVSNSCDPMDFSPPGSSVHGDFPGKNTGVGCHFLLQGIFPTQGLNSSLLHWQVNSFLLSHQGSPVCA